jgi:hypothetical protein
MEPNVHAPDPPARSRRAAAVFAFAAGLALVAGLALLASCGGRGGDNGKTGDGGKAEPPKGGSGGSAQAGSGEWAAGGDGQKKGEEEDVAPTDRSSLTPREREAIQEELNGVKNNLLLGDPAGFERAFITSDVLKSVITDLKGKEVWAAMVKAAGGHETEFQKEYKGRIRALYDGLRVPGPRCRLDEATLKAVRNAGLPARMLFADTFANPLGRNYVVVLTGYPDDKGVASLVRFRFLPHHNIRKLYLSGEEVHESAADLAARETERIAGALREIAKAQEAFRAAACADRDGDGKGEFGFLEELAGRDPEEGDGSKRFESALPHDLRETAVSGVALWDGHLIRAFLPGEKGPSFRFREGRADARAAADAREKSWWALAWPAGEGFGQGLYFVGPSGTVLRSTAPSPWRGLEKAPPFAAGFREGGSGTPLDG